MCRHGGLGPGCRCRASFLPAASPAPLGLVLSLPAPLSSSWLLYPSATLQTSCCLPSHTCPVIHGHGSEVLVVQWAEKVKNGCKTHPAAAPCGVRVHPLHEAAL